MDRINNAIEIYLWQSKAKERRKQGRKLGRKKERKRKKDKPSQLFCCCLHGPNS